MNFLAKTNGKRGEIWVYDAIGAGIFEDGMTAKAFAEALKKCGSVKALDVYVNSPGGSVFEGVAIYNQLMRFAGEKVVHIDGIAASIASVIAMAGDERRIAANGTVMIHDPYGAARGSAADMRKMADSLEQTRDVILNTYTERTKGDRSKISAWMAEETWMDAKTSVERGFATHVTEAKDFRAEFPLLQNFAKVPDKLRKAYDTSDAKLARMSMRISKFRASTV